MKPFYVTTPIYYVNDRPHIGHAYSTIAADMLSRYHGLRGRPTFLLTGTDEHGLKIERRAQQLGIAPQAFVDSAAPPFRQTFDDLHCSLSDFIRTSEDRHKEGARRLWSQLVEAGDIYLGDYEDWYCVACESFYTEKDLLEERSCPVHKRPVERIKEKSYFFRLSRYDEPLLQLYEKHPRFVQPEGRFNEVKSFVREGLRDISISRTSFRWGITAPDDPEHVMWVWIDALSNYITALGGPPDSAQATPLLERFWPPHGEAVHIVGKDILRFHAIYWPAFLLSAGIAPPSQVFAHGWLTVNGEKMSKTAGNFLAPEPLSEAVGSDALRYYFMREITFGLDGDFSHANLVARYHGDLGNGLGNLLNRIVSSIVRKHFDGRVPPSAPAHDPQSEALVSTAQRVRAEAARHYEAIAPQRALESIWELVGAANRYVDQTAPWSLAKTGERQQLAHVCYTVLETLRWLSLMLWPVMPHKCNALRYQLGLAAVYPTEELDRWPEVWGGLQAGTRTQAAAPLFPRLGPDTEQNLMAQAQPSRSPASSKKKGKPMISIDDLSKVDLRVGKILSAERVPKSDRLLKLSVDLAEDHPRQILAGIAEHYEPRSVLGLHVVVVANLKPRKMMGLQSEGMVLAASDDKGLRIATVDPSIPCGSEVR